MAVMPLLKTVRDRKPASVCRLIVIDISMLCPNTRSDLPAAKGGQHARGVLASRSFPSPHEKIPVDAYADGQR